jgi:predicted nucleic acid-binding protein
MIVVLDSGPLGLISNPKGKADALRCGAWLRTLLANGIRVALPEIADYEVRRELLRASKATGVRRLDDFKTSLDFVPISTAAMLRAAEFWALARRQGQPTAPDHALDGDVILAAQARLLEEGANEAVVVATLNVGHLARFVDARHWTDIT